jgi:hypothetical protein
MVDVNWAPRWSFNLRDEDSLVLQALLPRQKVISPSQLIWSSQIKPDRLDIPIHCHPNHDSRNEATPNECMECSPGLSDVRCDSSVKNAKCVALLHVVVAPSNKSTICYEEGIHGVDRSCEKVCISLNQILN